MPKTLSDAVRIVAILNAAYSASSLRSRSASVRYRYSPTASIAIMNADAARAVFTAARSEHKEARP